MLRIACQLLRGTISHYLLLGLNDSPCKSWGTEAEPWMNTFQTHRELPGRSFSRAMHMLWAQALMQMDLLCSPRVLVLFIASKGWALPGVWGNPVPHFVWSFGSTFWQHLLGDKHVAACAGGWGELAVSRSWSALGLATGLSTGCPCSCSHSPGLSSTRGAGNVCSVPYTVFQQEVVCERATSFVTVVALNRKWLIFHDYFSVRHDSWENASVWLAGENEPALLSFKWRCSQALHANIPTLDESSLSAWLMLDCHYVTA